MIVKEESDKERAIEERDEAIAELVSLHAKAVAHDEVIEQFHWLLTADNQRNHTDLTSQLIFDKMTEEVRDNMSKIQDYSVLKAKYNVEKRRAERLSLHINYLSQSNVMHLLAARFYAMELAASRQMLDLVQKAPTIDLAVKSKLWDDLDKQNQVLRRKTLLIVNRINSDDRTDAAFENGDDWQSPPRVVILMKDHINQGLGLEISGGAETFRPILVTNKMRRSMADDEQLRINDRILAIDGTFVTNTTTHAEAMELLTTGASNNFIALIVSQFDPTKYNMAHSRH
uniref:PDZ domain-containing protein n=1 Tax=Caenorhabditis tropicalis TaxID=1561998 RepID=A0A1I7T6Z9_9PELO